MGGYPGFSRWAHGNHKGPYEGKREEKGMLIEATSGWYSWPLLALKRQEGDHEPSNVFLYKVER